MNVSASQLAERDFVFAVKRIVRETNLDPRLLGIEVTESILISDVESSLAILNELARLASQYNSTTSGQVIHPEQFDKMPGRSYQD